MKAFERAELKPNDDGTFTISITPKREEKEGEGENAIMNYPETKTYTAASLEEAIGKIQSFASTGPEKEITKPEDGEDADDMDTFMEPRMVEEKDESDYKGE